MRPLKIVATFGGAMALASIFATNTDIVSSFPLPHNADKAQVRLGSVPATSSKSSFEAGNWTLKQQKTPSVPHEESRSGPAPLT